MAVVPSKVLDRLIEAGWGPELITKYRSYYTRAMRMHMGRVYRDANMRKVYASEDMYEAILKNTPHLRYRKFVNFAAVQARFFEIVNSDQWADIKAFATNDSPCACPTVISANHRGYRGRAWSHKITLNPKCGFDEPTMLHELAHVVAGIRARHGPVFRVVHLKIVETFLGEEEADILREEYRRKGLSIKQPPPPMEPERWLERYNRLKKARNERQLYEVR